MPNVVPDFKQDLNKKIKNNNTINSLAYNPLHNNVNPAISKKQDFKIFKKSKKIITNKVVGCDENCEDVELLANTIIEFVMKHFSLAWSRRVMCLKMLIL